MKMAQMSLTLVLIIASTLISHAVGDSAQEKQKCAEQLTGIATCLPYVGGDAKSPTPDCCSGLIQAIKNNKKCICVIVKDRDDPDLGLKVNITLALALPSLCKAPDNLSQCPALLHLDPKSPEAQAFNQLRQNTKGGSVSPSASPSSSVEEAAATTAPAKNNASYERKSLIESLVIGLVILFFGALLT